MSGLAEFQNRLAHKLKSVSREPHWAPGEADRYMADIAERRDRVEKIAIQYTTQLIQPRIEALASCIVNASITKDLPPGKCECWFGYCERFPSNTRIAFSIEHDVHFENIAVCYDVSMVPLFVRFNEHDRLTMALAEVNEDRVSGWVEKRIEEFLDTYLRIDRGMDDFADEPVIDPVCGMRVSRSSAATSDSYYGHPFFFCSESCREKFEEDPAQYAQIKTM